MNIRGLFAATLSIVIVQAGHSLAKDLRSVDISKSTHECVADRNYSPGGAMVGDCLQDRAKKVELEIAANLHRASKRFCDRESREQLQKIQSLWHDYRETFCFFVEESPGNTPAYINAGACRLQVTQQRLEALRTVGDPAFEWCLSLSFDSAASRFGSPPIKAVKHSESGIEWRRSAGGDKILIQKKRKDILVLDATGCSYCGDQGDCSEGVFFFEYPAPTKADLSSKNYAVLHACRKRSGIKFELSHDLLTTPKVVFRESGHKAFDWVVDDGRITMTISDNATKTWKAPE